MITLSYIGEECKRKSGGIMSSLYHFDADQQMTRWNWGLVDGALEEGQEVQIVQATPYEMCKVKAHCLDMIDGK